MVQRWVRPDVEYLLDYIDRLTDERFCEAPPVPPTEEEIQRGVLELDSRASNRQPEISPALPGYQYQSEFGDSEPVKNPEFESGFNSRANIFSNLRSPESVNKIIRRVNIEINLTQEYEIALEKYKSRRNVIKNEAKNELHSNLYMGATVAFEEREDGDIPIDRYYWPSDAAATSLETGLKNGRKIILKIERPKPVASKNDAIIRCRDYLIEERKRFPGRQPKTKEAYKIQCSGFDKHGKQKGDGEFDGLSSHGFEEAWKQAAQMEPAPGWGKAGRPKNQME